MRSGARSHPDRQFSMKRLILPLCLVAVLLAGCGSKSNADQGPFPDGFLTQSDSERVAYVMANATPDSTARFIINAALGKVKGARIDTLATATLYAYEHFRDQDLSTFSDAFDGYMASLPLGEKMKVYLMSGKADPQNLGLQLGLEYVGDIRDGNKTVEEIDNELAAFKDACAEDSATYRRFVKGFKAALTVDQGKDLAPEVYSRYSNMKE